MIEVRDKKIVRYNVLSKIKIRPTAEDDYAEYSCEARHEALPAVMPFRATVHLSVLCKFPTRSLMYIYHICTYWFASLMKISSSLFIREKACASFQKINPHVTTAHVIFPRQCKTLYKEELSLLTGLAVPLSLSLPFLLSLLSITSSRLKILLNIN